MVKTGDPKQVPCPKCSAAAGQRCVTTGRIGKQKLRKLHTARRRAG